jgi:hypothetical protein
MWSPVGVEATARMVREFAESGRCLPPRSKAASAGKLGTRDGRNEPLGSRPRRGRARRHRTASSPTPWRSATSRTNRQAESRAGEGGHARPRRGKSGRKTPPPAPDSLARTPDPAASTTIYRPLRRPHPLGNLRSEPGQRHRLVRLLAVRDDLERVGLRPQSSPDTGSRKSPSTVMELRYFGLTGPGSRVVLVHAVAVVGCL